MDIGNSKVVTLSDFQPITFAERGMVVGFTKPDFFLSRIRPAGKGAMELLVRNISGGKGYYVVNWRGLSEAMPLTLHDSVLYQAISQLPSLDPAAIRTAGLAVAKEGYAGEEAPVAALALESGDRDMALLTQFGLIAALLSESGVKNVSLMSVAAADAAEQDMLRGALRRIAPDLGVDPVHIFKFIEAMADALFPVGMPTAPMPGRHRRTLAQLIALENAMNVWVEEEPTELRGAAAFIAAAAQINIKIMQQLLGELDQDLSQIMRFFKLWTADEKSVRERLQRVSWVLDGWDHLINIWSAAAGQDRHTQRAAVEEISLLTPAVPREGLDWLSVRMPGALNDKVIQRRWVKANEDWRSAVTTLGQISRNEKLLARRT
jgi:hypothetical protein